MTYNMSWYKAFSVSCAVHLVMLMSLAILMGNADFRQLPERYIPIEFTEAAVGNSQAGVPAHSSTISSAGKAASHQAAPARMPTKLAVTHPVSGPDTGQPMAETGENTVGAEAADGIEGGEAPVAQTVAGSGLAASSGGQTGGGDIDSIINAFLQQIEKRKDYPYMARRRGQEGTVTVAVRLTAAGELAGVEVVRSSGVDALDEAALNLVRRVCPFYHNTGRTFAMNIPITYQLD